MIFLHPYSHVLLLSTIGFMNQSQVDRNVEELRWVVRKTTSRELLK